MDQASPHMANAAATIAWDEGGGMDRDNDLRSARILPIGKWIGAALATEQDAVRLGVLPSSNKTCRGGSSDYLRLLVFGKFNIFRNE